jgi:hypothetical protein
LQIRGDLEFTALEVPSGFRPIHKLKNRNDVQKFFRIIFKEMGLLLSSSPAARPVVAVTATKHNTRTFDKNPER